MFPAVSALFCCIIFPVCLRAQDDTFRNLSLSNPEKNIVYIGVNNQIVVAGMKAPVPVDYMREYEIRDLEGETFILIPAATGNFRFHYTDVNDQAQTVYFEVRKVPLPEIKLAGIYQDTYTIQEILDNPRLVIVCDVPDTYLNYEVVSYLVAFNMNGSYIKYRATGSDLPQDFLQILPLMPSGTKIYFDEIRVKMPGGEVHVMNHYVKILR